MLTVGTVNGAEKASKDHSSRGFRELKEALKILESLKNMTVEQLWTGGSPTSPTSAEPASTTQAPPAGAAAGAEKPTKEKRFLDDIKKLQENLRKTLDNVAIVEEEKMEAVVGAGGSAQVPEVGSFAWTSPLSCPVSRTLLLCSGRASWRGEASTGATDPSEWTRVAQRRSE